MTRDQARALIHAADALPAKMGRGATFRRGTPCCAFGHLAVGIGFACPLDESLSAGVSEVEAAYGLPRGAWIVEANDDSPPRGRRRNVIRAIEDIVRSCGYDADGLRGESAS